jgi:hypothetical protein
MSKKTTYFGPAIRGPHDGKYLEADETRIEIPVKAEGPNYAFGKPNYDFASYEFLKGRWIYRSTRKGMNDDQARVRAPRRNDFA